MANVVIDIAAEFTGNKAFKQAGSSTDKLTKGVKRLAGSLGIAFGTAQVIAFGKASVKAAMDAQAQQERLSNLLKVTVGATQQQVQVLYDQAAALQNVGVVNKENIIQTQSQLATFNLQIDTIKQLTPAILDYVTAEKGAAASADQFKQMTNGLAQALNGNFASLTKVGFVLDENTKKTIKNGTESERAAALVKVLNSTYKGFNESLAKTDAGQMQILANAADEAREIIGVGLLDALKSIGDDGSVENLATGMQDFALYVADAARGLGIIIDSIQKIPGIEILTKIIKSNLGAAILLGKAQREADERRATSAQALSHLAELESKYSKNILSNTKKLTAEELKQLKAKQLKAAIDKANLALNKGQDIFDMDKIQIAAALTNQAEQLGKATTTSQYLQIANDTARLNVKRSILALEDAIAAKDEQAIIAATAKLNADLKVLGVLSGQTIQLSAIKSILEGLKPVSLIDQNNLDEALKKIREMLDMLGKVGSRQTPANPYDGTWQNRGGVAASGIPVGDFIEPISTAGGSIAAITEYSDAATARANAFALLMEQQNYADLLSLIDYQRVVGDFGGYSPSMNTGAGYGSTIIVNTGVGDPNAIAEAVDQVLRDAYQRGTLTTVGAFDR
jgi:tetratricopeptide (TPR) repeat protein